MAFLRLEIRHLASEEEEEERQKKDSHAGLEKREFSFWMSNCLCLNEHHNITDTAPLLQQITA